MQAQIRQFQHYDPETGYVVITPSGVARDVLGPEHVCVMDLSGKVIERAAEVKPSGVSRDVLTAKHICVMDLDGKVIERLEDLKPSSEARCTCIFIRKERNPGNRAYTRPLFHCVFHHE